MVVNETPLDDVMKSIQRTERYLKALQQLVVEAVGAAGGNHDLSTKLDVDYKELTKKTTEQLKHAVEHVARLKKTDLEHAAKLKKADEELGMIKYTVEALETEFQSTKTQYEQLRGTLDVLKQKLLDLKPDFGRAPVFV